MVVVVLTAVAFITGCGGQTTGSTKSNVVGGAGSGATTADASSRGGAGGLEAGSIDGSATGGASVTNCDCFAGPCAPGTHSVQVPDQCCPSCQPCGAVNCPNMPACGPGEQPITSPGQCCPTACGPTHDGGAGGVGSGGATGTLTGCDAAASYTPDKTCASDADCVIADSGDCCGTTEVGVRKGTEAAFVAANQQALSCIPGCGLRGCFHADVDEEGKTGSSFIATCDTGACRSHAQ